LRLDFQFPRKIWRKTGTAARFSFSVITLQATTMVCNLAILVWLVPEEIGLWQSLLLIGTYTGILSGPVTSGLNRELPFNAGKGERESMMGLAGTAQRVAIIASLICILSIPFTVIVFSGDLQRFAAAAVLLGTGAQIYRQYLNVLYKAAQCFDRLAGFQLAEAVLVAATLPLVAAGGLFGLAVRFAALSLIVTVLTWLYRPMRRVGRPSWLRLRQLVGVGVPLFASSYAATVAKTLPRVMLLSVGGVQWVGLFAPASALLRGFSMLPTSLAIYFYPRMSHRFGRTGDPRSLRPTVYRVVLANIVVAIPAVIGVFFVAPAVLGYFFPAYEASIPSMLIVALAGFFLSSGIAGNALHSLKAWKWIAITAGARLALFGGLPWVGYLWFQDLEGIAWGVTAAFAGEFFVTLFAVRAATGFRPAGTEVT